MSGPSAIAKPISAKITVTSSNTWLIGWMRPATMPAGRTGRVTSSASAFSRFSNAAARSRARREARASVTSSLSAFIAAPALLRSSSDILPNVASTAEIEPFLPSAATRAASSVLSSEAAAMAARVSDLRAARSVMFLSIKRAGTQTLLPLCGRRWRVEPDEGLLGDGAPRLRRPRPLPLVGEGKTSSRRLGQMPLGSLDDRGECRRLGDREVREHLAVDLDASRDQARDEAAVGETVFARSRVDALNPQGAEFALAVLAVAVGILHRLFNGLLRRANGILAAAEIAFGGAQNFLVLGVGSYAAFDA